MSKFLGVSERNFSSAVWYSGRAQQEPISQRRIRETMNKPESKQESALFPWLLVATEGRLRWQDRLPPVTLKPRATSLFLNHKTNSNSSEEMWTQCDNSRDYIRPLLREKDTSFIRPSCSAWTVTLRILFIPGRVTTCLVSSCELFIPLSLWAGRFKIQSCSRPFWTETSNSVSDTWARHLMSVKLLEAFVLNVISTCKCNFEMLKHAWGTQAENVSVRMASYVLFLPCK